jgi:hypothetical protein
MESVRDANVRAVSHARICTRAVLRQDARLLVCVCMSGHPTCLVCAYLGIRLVLCVNKTLALIRVNDTVNVS